MTQNKKENIHNPPYPIYFLKKIPLLPKEKNLKTFKVHVHLLIG
jgi:hypothetical protein